jgi:hypothetical protein
MKKNILFLLVIFTILLHWSAAQSSVPDTAVNQKKTVEFQIIEQSEISFSAKQSLNDFEVVECVDGVNKTSADQWKLITARGMRHQREPGHPDLAYTRHFVTIPNGSKAVLKYTVGEKSFEKDIEIGPVPQPRSLSDTSTAPFTYIKNDLIYSTDSLYPRQAVEISEVHDLRGFSVVSLSIHPFQYNPIAKELAINRDIEVTIIFEGGNGTFGDSRLRNRWWDPILRQYILNSNMITEVNYDKLLPTKSDQRDITGCDYLIIRPNGSDFAQWADTIKKYRTEQGIYTEVVSLAQIGGNDQTIIKNYLQNVYQTWDPVPAAVLFLGDHDSDANTSILSHNYENSQYGNGISDILYVDFNGDSYPEIMSSRITARNAIELQAMITKFISHETNPPIEPSFYNTITSVAAYENLHNFGLAAESFRGYWFKKRGRSPLRLYVATSTPTSVWQGNSYYINLFGPNQLNYIPAHPNHISWTGGNSITINNTINSGSFLVQHADHGNITRWVSPSYTIESLSNLTNSAFPFVLSLNCSSGAFQYTCHAETMHRRSNGTTPHGVVGIMAATTLSWDPAMITYSYGFYDYLWPDFMPDVNPTAIETNLNPGFATIAANLYLGNGYANSHTNYVTHFHGDAFLTLYDTIPAESLVLHNNVINPNETVFTAFTETGLMLTLTHNGTIVQSLMSVQNSTQFTLPDNLAEGDLLVFTATAKRNTKPYRKVIHVSEYAPALSILSAHVDDSGINQNGLLDYNENPMLGFRISNIGAVAEQYSIKLLQGDQMLTFENNLAAIPFLAANQTTLVESLFHVYVDPNVSDGYVAKLIFELFKNDTSFFSMIQLPVYAPEISFVSEQQPEEIMGNYNGRWDAGESILWKLRFSNTGGSAVEQLHISLTGGDQYIQLQDFETIINPFSAYNEVVADFSLFASPDCPDGHSTSIGILMTDYENNNLQWSHNLVLQRKTAAVIVNLDSKNSSAPALQSALLANGIPVEIVNQIDEQINKYFTVFACLGTYPDNHILTSPESELLVNFLANGGALYMEGADTWCHDQQMAVHPMFKILCVDDGTSNSLQTIYSVADTIDPSITLAYSGDNRFIDRIDIQPDFNAKLLLRNMKGSTDFGTTVFYNGGHYRTIGSSHEFGGLQNGSDHRNRLMAIYLHLLKISPVVNWLGINGNWFDPINWSNNSVPGESTITTIPSIPAGGLMPLIFDQSDIIRSRSLIIKQGATITIPPGKALEIN